MIRERRKWEIILLDNIQSSEARKVSFKIPQHIKYCKGLMFSCNTPGAAANNYMMGNVSLFFEDRKIHPLHYTIQEKPLGMITGKREELKLDECIRGGSYIQGYYVDLGLSTGFPYRVRIYLDCIQEVEFVTESKTPPSHG